MSNQKVQNLTSAPPDGKKAVLLFWAPWHEASVESGSMGQVLNALASTTAKDDIVFGRVEAEEVPSLTSKYGVTAVPTFVLLDGSGTVVSRLEGDEDIAGVTQAVQNLIQSSSSGGSGGATAAPAVADAPTPEQRLTQRLDNLIKSSEIMLFMKGEPGAPRCGFSRQIVEILQEEKIPFGSFDILSDEDVRQGLKKHSNWPTYPQMYSNGELLGGLDIIKEMKEDGPLREQLGISDEKVAPTETLNERLGKLIKRHKIMLFMKGLPSAPKCGFSRQMVELLNDTGAAYDTFNILEDEDVRQGLKKYSDWPTYPQLYVNGDLIGGLDIVKELIESGEFDSVLDG